MRHIVIIIIAFCFTACESMNEYQAFHNKESLVFAETNNIPNIWFFGEKINILTEIKKNNMSGKYYKYLEDSFNENLWILTRETNINDASLQIFRFRKINADGLDVHEITIDMNKSSWIVGISNNIVCISENSPYKEFKFINTTIDLRTGMKKTYKSNFGYSNQLFYDGKIIGIDGYYNLKDCETVCFSDKVNFPRVSKNGKFIVGLANYDSETKSGIISVFSIDNGCVEFSTSITRELLKFRDYDETDLYYLSDDYLYYSLDKTWQKNFILPGGASKRDWYVYDLKTCKSKRVESPNSRVKFLREI